MTSLLLTVALAAGVFQYAPVFPSPAAKWTAQLDERKAQGAAIKEEQSRIEMDAQPLYVQQQQIEAKEQPFLAEKKRIDGEWEKYAAGSAPYKTRCTSRKFETPREQAAYDSCIREYEQREGTRKKLDEQEDANNAKLKPLLDQWMKIETQMEPHMLAWKDLSKKLTAVNHEIQRLNALLAKDAECVGLRDKARVTTASMTQLELEKLHLCESILFDGADPARLLADPALASIDPNLPPPDWKPKRFSITPNK
jgi:hypothetical protein